MPENCIRLNAQKGIGAKRGGENEFNAEYILQGIDVVVLWQTVRAARGRLKIQSIFYAQTFIALSYQPLR